VWDDVAAVGEGDHQLGVGPVKLAAVAALAVLADVRVPSAALDAGPAADAMVDEDAVADAEPGHIRPELDDLAAGPVPRHEQVDRRAAGGRPVAVQVAPANRGRANSHEDFARLGTGIRLVPHDRLAVAKKLYRAHLTLLVDLGKRPPLYCTNRS